MARPMVCIDIGHGSDTYKRTGGKGVRQNGKIYEEHEFNSDVAMRVCRKIEKNGIEPWLVQPPYSKEVPLSTRTDMANRRGVDLYWSIHANAGNPSVSGVCAFYWYTSKEGKKLAESFADNAKDAGFDLHGNGTHASKPGTWTDLHVCRETTMTAVLTENGFMTNSKDFEGIFGSQKEEYRERIADVHAKTICEFFGIKYKEEVSMASLNEEQEKVRQYLMKLGITDGKNPGDPATNYYVWSAINQLIRVVYTDLNKVKQELKEEIRRNK